jgi:hypothetical protein
MISSLMQRPLRGEPTRAPNRISEAGYWPATFAAHAALVIAAASALLISSAPAMAGCTGLPGITYCSDGAPAGAVTYEIDGDGRTQSYASGKISTISFRNTLGSSLHNMGVLTQSINMTGAWNFVTNFGIL